MKLLLTATLAAAGPLPWSAPDGSVLAAHERSAAVEPVLIEDGVFPPCLQPRQAVPHQPAWAFASSELAEGSVVHDATRAIDGDPATAWVEGVKGPGVGERLVVAASDAHGVALVPGYAKDEGRWSKNHRVSKVQIRWLRRKDGLPEKDRYAPEDLELMTERGLVATLKAEGGVIPFGKMQHVDFETLWHQDMSATEIVAIELTVLDTDGAQASYEDTCISEVVLLTHGDPAGAPRCAKGWCDSQSNAANIEGCKNPR